VNKVAKMPARERADLFAETAARKVLPEAIIEKDFWVCWMLKQLFSTEALSGRLLFKAGTSLSKIFHAINRFSEDIDLAVEAARTCSRPHCGTRPTLIALRYDNSPFTF